MPSFPKVNPLHQPSQKTRQKAAYRVLRPHVRADTFHRDGGRCRCPCRRYLHLTSDDPWLHANIHERTGGVARRTEAIDVTLRSTVTLAKECHEAVERHRMTIEILNDALGFNGDIMFRGRMANGTPLAGYRSAPTLTPPNARRLHGQEKDTTTG